MARPVGTMLRSVGSRLPLVRPSRFAEWMDALCCPTCCPLLATTTSASPDAPERPGRDDGKRCPSWPRGSRRPACAARGLSVPRAQSASGWRPRYPRHPVRDCYPGGGVDVLLAISERGRTGVMHMARGATSCSLPFRPSTTRLAGTRPCTAAVRFHPRGGGVSRGRGRGQGPMSPWASRRAPRAGQERRDDGSAWWTGPQEPRAAPRGHRLLGGF